MANHTASFADTLSLADTVARQMGKQATDLLPLSESIGRLTNRLVSDALSFVEAWGKILWSGVPPFAPVTGLWPARLWSATGTMLYAAPKDPESIEDFQIDWSALLASTPNPGVSDAIVASAWEIPAPLIAVMTANTATLAAVRLSGGIAGQVYALKNVVTCASGRVLPQPLLLPVTF